MITTLNALGQKTADTTIYQFKVASLEGEDFDFSTLEGKKIMIVNTASKCGLTPQYKKLQALLVSYHPLHNYGLLLNDYSNSYLLLH